MHDDSPYDDVMQDDVMQDDVMQDDVMQEDVMQEDVMQEDVMQEDAMDHDTPDDARPRPSGPPGVLDALREGWHALGGGEADRCPGCPVCRLSEQAGRMDPATSEHLQQAVGHVVAAGRELLAALSLGGAPDPSPTSGPPPPPTGTERAPEPAPEPGRARTRIPVGTPDRTAHQTPEQHDEEQA